MGNGESPKIGGKMDKILIGTRAVGQDEPPYFIAEIGANHNGKNRPQTGSHHAITKTLPKKVRNFL